MSSPSPSFTLCVVHFIIHLFSYLSSQLSAPHATSYIHSSRASLHRWLRTFDRWLTVNATLRPRGSLGRWEQHFSNLIQRTWSRRSEYYSIVICSRKICSWTVRAKRKLAHARVANDPLSALFQRLRTRNNLSGAINEWTLDSSQLSDIICLLLYIQTFHTAQELQKSSNVTLFAVRMLSQLLRIEKVGHLPSIRQSTECEVCSARLRLEQKTFR